MKCLLDLDDVLTNFVVEAYRFHGLEFSYANYPYSLGEWEICPPPGSDMTPEHFWDSFDSCFWSTLSWTSFGKELLSLVENCFGKENICILTTPTRNSSCAAGKLEWIQRELPDYSRRFLIGPAKQFCASRDHWLIDDADHNIKAFKEAGGNTILVPRKWNSRYYCNTMETVKNELKILEKTNDS